MSLPYGRWRRVSTTPGQSDTILFPVVNRNGANAVVSVDVSSRVARVIAPESAPDHRAFLTDAGTGSRYVLTTADTIHRVTAIGPEILAWDATPWRGRVRGTARERNAPSGLVGVHNGAMVTDPALMPYRAVTAGQTALYTSGGDRAGVEYPDELLTHVGLPVTDGPLAAVEGRDAGEIWLVLTRAFQDLDDDETSSIGIYRLAASGDLLGGGLVTPNIAALTGDSNNDVPAIGNAFRVRPASAGLPMKVKRVGTSVTQSLTVAGPDGALVEIVPSVTSHIVEIVNPPRPLLDADVIAFSYGGTDYTLQSLSRLNPNTLLGTFRAD